MSAYDQWLERAPVDALTAAEADDGLVPEDGPCWNCGHDHAQRSREPDEVSPFVPSHSDFCDCEAKPRMVCARCYGTPDDLCERYRCDDPRIP